MASYSRPPITEAAVELQVRPSPAASLDALASVGGPLASEFPNRTQIVTTQAQVSTGLQPEVSAHARAVGWTFASNDGRDVAQATETGLTVSRLAPYGSWESFRRVAQQFWVSYREVAKPEAITRIGTRYINQIEVPLPFGDFREFVRTAPDVAPGIEQGLQSYFIRVEAPYPDDGTLLILQTALLPTAAKSKVVQILLDIDVILAQDVPQQDDGIWEVFELLHHRKNEVFEANITDRVRKLIQ